MVLPSAAAGLPHSHLGVRRRARRPQPLLALNTVAFLPAAGYEFGRYFDAAASRAGLSLAQPPRAEAPPRVRTRPEEKLSKPFPFVLDIPAVPPMPFERAFRRVVLKKESEGYDSLIGRYAEEAGLDPRLVKSIVAAESEFTARAVSPAGALGLMQVMPATAEYMGVPRTSLFDPEENVRAGTRYLTYLFARAWKRYHLEGVPYAKAPAWLVQRVIAAYNAGPRFLKHRPLYAQTRDYVRKVLLFYRSRVSALAAR
ncbi:MAG: lytic transglycosylase domain-containing protein [Elusimicrobiota bacterium]|nr:MAG: lytic transglycosylase domain-containing protein [Elusimicrobiota bacterium]